MLVVRWEFFLGGDGVLTWVLVGDGGGGGFVVGVGRAG